MEDETTQELRIDQIRREQVERGEAERARTENDTAKHERRADRAAYLRDKLKERAAAEERADGS